MAKTEENQGSNSTSGSIGKLSTRCILCTFEFAQAIGMLRDICEKGSTLGPFRVYVIGINVVQAVCMTVTWSMVLVTTDRDKKKALLFWSQVALSVPTLVLAVSITTYGTLLVKRARIFWGACER